MKMPFSRGNAEVEANRDSAEREPKGQIGFLGGAVHIAHRLVPELSDRLIRSELVQLGDRRVVPPIQVAGWERRLAHG